MRVAVLLHDLPAGAVQLRTAPQLAEAHAGAHRELPGAQPGQRAQLSRPRPQEAVQAPQGVAPLLASQATCPTYEPKEWSPARSSAGSDLGSASAPERTCWKFIRDSLLQAFLQRRVAAGHGLLKRLEC